MRRLAAPRVTEEQAGVLLLYVFAAVRDLPGKRDHQVAGYVSQKAASGSPFTLSTKELVRRFGMNRRTAWGARLRLLENR